MIYTPTQPRLTMPQRCLRCGKYRGPRTIRTPRTTRTPTRLPPRWRALQSAVNLAGVQIDDLGRELIDADGKTIVAEATDPCCCTEPIFCANCPDSAPAFVTVTGTDIELDPRCMGCGSNQVKFNSGTLSGEWCVPYLPDCQWLGAYDDHGLATLYDATAGCTTPVGTALTIGVEVIVSEDPFSPGDHYVSVVINAACQVVFSGLYGSYSGNCMVDRFGIANNQTSFMVSVPNTTDPAGKNGTVDVQFGFCGGDTAL
jgi:hypothetical protein